MLSNIMTMHFIMPFFDFLITTEPYYDPRPNEGDYQQLNVFCKTYGKFSLVVSPPDDCPGCSAYCGNIHQARKPDPCARGRNLGHL